MKMVRIHAASDAQEPRHLEDPRCARGAGAEIPVLEGVGYAGIAVDLTGAAFAWAVVRDSDSVSNASHIIAPLAGLALALTSWALRPDSRKLPG